jgi:dolichol-phosphate mannosyltransferase
MTATLQDKNPISIVMPVYNEEEILERTVREHHSEIIEAIPGSEFVIVDDCSTDKSPRILERLEKELSGIKVLRPEKNGGHGKALRLGFENASCDLIFHTDSDYQNNPKDFWKLYSKLEHADLIIGYRSSRSDPLHRLVITRLLRLVNMLSFGYYIKDANSPFKLVSKKCLINCLESISPDAFAPSILLALTAKWKGYRVMEIPVEHFARKTGKVSIANWKLIKACLMSLSNTIKLRKTLGESKLKNNK